MRKRRKNCWEAEKEMKSDDISAVASSALVTLLTFVIHSTFYHTQRVIT